MTERKPAGMSFESWIDQQIRDAQERGEFDNLPGKGKPIKGLDQPHDEMWWVRQLMVREELSFTPPALKLRQEVDEARAKMAAATSEADVRAILSEVNEKIREVNRKPLDGPPTTIMPFDVERTVARWHERRREESTGASADAGG